MEAIFIPCIEYMVKLLIDTSFLYDISIGMSWLAWLSLDSLSVLELV